jgi:archaeal chaperonin
MMEDNRIIRGRDAQRMIVDTAWEMAEAVRATLGPRGMDMMLVDRMGNKVLTNDGATILKALETKDPVASIIAEVAKSQEQNAFDGTTTCIIIMGELLRRADELIGRGVHPNAIIKGYRIGLDQALQAAKDAAIKKEPYAAGVEVATTALTGKSAEDFVEVLADICAKAAILAKPSEIKLLTIPGNPKDAHLVEGLVVLKSPMTQGMPKKTDGPILLLESEFGPPQAQVNINDPEKIQQIVEMQTNYMQEIMERVKSHGIKTIFCQRGVDSRAAQWLRKEGILAFKNIKRSDMMRLAVATQGHIISDPADINEEDLGYCVAEVHESVNDYVSVKGIETNAASIIMPAPTEQSAEEFQRALEDAVGVAYLCVQEPLVVLGAGTIQAQMYHAMMKKENHSLIGMNSKVEAARLAFAEALLVIPQTLAESAGMDIMDVSVRMRADPNLGVNVHQMELQPMSVFEPLTVVRSALTSAVENGVSLLRTHSIILAKPIQEIFAQAEK